MKVSVAMIEMTRATPAARAYWWSLGVLDARPQTDWPICRSQAICHAPWGADRSSSTAGRSDDRCCAKRVPGGLCRRAAKLAIVRAAYRLEAWCPPQRHRTERCRIRRLRVAGRRKGRPPVRGTAAALPPHERVAKIAEGAPHRPAGYALTAAVLGRLTSCARSDTPQRTMALEMATAPCSPNLPETSSRSTRTSPSAETIVTRLAAWAVAKNWPLELPHLDHVPACPERCAGWWHAKSVPISAPLNKRWTPSS